MTNWKFDQHKGFLFPALLRFQPSALKVFFFDTNDANFTEMLVDLLAQKNFQFFTPYWCYWNHFFQTRSCKNRQICLKLATFVFTEIDEEISLHWKNPPGSRMGLLVATSAELSQHWQQVGVRKKHKSSPKFDIFASESSRNSLNILVFFCIT